MSFRDKALELLARESCAALVTLSRVEGSSPREAGAQMLVTAAGFIGSIGGGTLEWQAIAEAQSLLSSISHDSVEGFSAQHYSLGPDLGQCCGGRVTVSTQIVTSIREFEARLTPEPTPRHILLYGAGHVGKALILLLAQSPFAVSWIDPRAAAFPDYMPANVTIRNDGNVLRPIASVPDGSMAVVMSHSHELDFAVTDAALRNRSVAHVLLIGSQTKRARFLSRLTFAGHTSETLARLICPIGDGTISGKTPYAVALSTAHQLAALDEALAFPQSGTVTIKESQAG